MQKFQKNLLFHLISILFAAFVVTYAVDIFDAGENSLSWPTIFKAVAVLAPVYWGIGQVVERLAQRYKRGALGEYLQFLLKNYFQFLQPFKESHDDALQRGLNKLRNSIEEYCSDQVHPANYEGLREIEDLPWNVKKIKGGKEEAIPVAPGLTLPSYLADHYKDQKGDSTAVFITGAPGAGKSYTLKQIALSILSAETPLVPLYLPISTWKSGTPIKEWVIATVSEDYMDGMRAEAIEALLDRKIKGCSPIFLLDGLDELTDEEIEPFIAMLLREFQLEDFIISTRPETFVGLKGNQIISSCYCYHIQELDQAYIQGVLNEQAAFAELPNLDLHDEIYKEINSPLLVDLLIKVLKGKGKDFSEEDFKSKKLVDRLWETYISLVYNDKAKRKTASLEALENNGQEEAGKKFYFTEKQLKTYSIELAKRLEDAGEYFTIGELQPAVLKERWARHLYALITRLLIGVVVSIGIGFIMSGPLDFILPGLLSGLVAFVFFILPFKPLQFDKSKDLSRANKISWGIRGLLGVLAYFLASMVVTGLYFAASGLRRPSDMWESLALGDMVIGLFFAILLTVLCGIHDLKYGFKDDVQLIEKKFAFNTGYFDFRGAFQFTMSFALVMGTVVSLLAVLFAKMLPGYMFSLWMAETASSWHMALFPMAFFSVFPVMLMLGIAIGLNNPENYRMEASLSADKEKALSLPNYSIRRTLMSALRFFAVVSIVIAVAWSWACMELFKSGWDAGNRGILNGIATGMLVGLWWGWKDLIKLWILRLILYFRGLAPLYYSKLLKDLEVLGVLERIGARFKFSHKTLGEYYSNEPSRALGKNFSWVLPLVILSVLLALSYRIAKRDQFYWKSHLGVNLEVKGGAVEKLDSQTVVARQEGHLEIRSKGLVRAGRVMGNVSPLGSETGFFCFPLNESFDIYPEFRHCALLYQRSGNEAWNAVYDKQEIPFGAIFPPLKWHVGALPVKANDTLRFMVNDGEWENNFGEFQVELTLLPLPGSK